jgi:hypothetical protein
LSADLAEEVVRRSAEGYRYAAVVAEVTGGKGRTLGVNVMVVVGEPGTGARQLGRYVAGRDRVGSPVRPTAPAVASDHPGTGAFRRLLFLFWWAVLAVLGIVALMLILRGP